MSNVKFTVKDGVLTKIQKTYIRDIVIPEEVREIKRTVYTYTGIQNIEISEGVEAIGYRAFSSNIQLLSVSFPSSMKKIEDEVFCYCDSLKIIKMKSIIQMGKRVFTGCDKLKAENLDHETVLYCF